MPLFRSCGGERLSQLTLETAANIAAQPGRGKPPWHLLGDISMDALLRAPGNLTMIPAGF